ncbi:glycosyltransferase [Aquamicrobium sp. LC103]|uniref:glycosyltransferase n=1 Tax=Aquamicrobium sp. LC103 TaxID=1120658 RepID=UPI00063E8151|nr:glycosyltransferase [Aquamicrobium sp. LC103]TKT77651.1 glycosyltransferase [Aquamicrobium sp. LC103]
MTTERAETAAPLLTICIVVYRSDPATMEATLTSLSTAARPLGLERVRLVIVDNSPEETPRDWLGALPSELPFEVISGHGNVGYGRANNMVLDQLGEYHLVLNPDVEMAPDALSRALAFMAANADCGLLAPAAFHPDGQRQYLCKRYPAIVDLLLRGFAPAAIRRLFRKRLDHYEMRDLIGEETVWDPPIASGCFMFFRGAVFRTLAGFDERYLLYFEDFDISLRAGRIARIAYVPSVRIVHGGGAAARKGFWHIRQFVRSAGIFFTAHRIKFY